METSQNTGNTTSEVGVAKVLDHGESRPWETPILSFQDRIISTVRSSPVTIVVGPTGCGKTTHIPAMLYQAGFEKKGKIACALPTRPAAKLAANFVAKSAHETVGQTVGYHVRFERRFSQDSTGILYLTAGMLLRRIYSDTYLREFSVIMVDEVHERRMETDVLLCYLKSLLRQRPDLRIIISSATMQSGVFSKYFDNAPVVTIVSRQYPVEIRYQPAGDSIPKAIAEAVCSIHRSEAEGDILVFLPGVREILKVQAIIHGLRLDGVECLPLYGNQNTQKQTEVFAAIKGRKVILATNIAETSVTIPGVCHVIDPGYFRHDRYNPAKGVTTLWVRRISKDSATQRAGRAGRTAPGTCTRLYTEASYRARHDTSQSEVKSSDTTDLVLELLASRIEKPEELDLLTPLSVAQMQHARHRLHEWGALDDEGHLTKLGTNMARLPLPAQLARMVLLTAEQGAGLEAAEVAAFLSIRDITTREGGVDIRIDGKHSQYRDQRGDAISFLRLKRVYAEHRGDRGWCEAQGIDIDFLELVYKIRDQIIYELKDLGLEKSFGADLDTIHRLLVRNWGGRLCFYHRNNTYSSGSVFGITIGKNSSISGAQPELIVAYDLLHVGTLIARYPLTVPKDMVGEAGQIYGYGQSPDCKIPDNAILRAKGVLRVETAHATSVVHIDLDCRRSSSRSLEVVRSRSILVEEDRFPISYLPLRVESKQDLERRGVRFLSELPKGEDELAGMGITADTRLDVHSALFSLGYVPSPVTSTETIPSSPAMLEDEEELQDDWLVQNAVEGPISELGLSRSAVMRLAGARIQKVSQLLELTREDLKRILQGRDALVEEVVMRLEDFGFELSTRGKERDSALLDGDLDLADDGTEIDSEQALEILGAEKFELFEAYRNASSQEGRLVPRNRLIVSNYGLITRTARSVLPLAKDDHALEFNDLAQEGVFGAMKAIAKYDVRKGYRYSTYATLWIKQVMRRLIMNQGVIRLPVHVVESKINPTRQAWCLFVKENKCRPTDAELAEKLGCSLSELHYRVDLLRMYRPLSLDAKMRGRSPRNRHNDEDNQTLLDRLADTVVGEFSNPEEIVERWLYEQAIKREMDRIFHELIFKLPARSIKVLKLRYGLEGEEPKTLEQVGEILGLTRERVRQIQFEAEKHIRTPEVWDRFRRIAPWMRKRPAEPKKKKVSLALPKMIGVEHPKLKGVAGSLQADINKFLSLKKRKDEGSLGFNTPEAVIEWVAGQYGLTTQELTSRTRKQDVVQARWFAIVLLRNRLALSFPQIAKLLGFSDHTSVMHGYQKGKEMFGDEHLVSTPTHDGEEG